MRLFAYWNYDIFPYVCGGEERAQAKREELTNKIMELRNQLQLVETELNVLIPS